MSVSAAHAFTLTRLATLSASALAALALCACASTGGLHTHATSIDADTLQVGRSLSGAALSPAAWPQQDWWRSYGDPQLDGIIDSALRGQPMLRMAVARVRQAQAMATTAGAALSPQLGAAVQSTNQRFSENGTVPKPLAGTWNSINSATLGAHYDLDLWGRNHAALEAAVDRAHASEVDLHAAQLLLSTTVTRIYLRLDNACAQQDLAKATLAQRQQILDLTRRRVAAQIDSSLELTQAEAALPQIRERIASIRESIALLKNQLAALQGRSPDAGLDIQRPQLADPVSASVPTNLPATLIGRRPDVIAARWRVEAASQDIKVARAQFYPDISLTAFVGLQSLGFTDFLAAGSRVAGLGPAISLPIFDGGRLRGNLAAHQAGYDAAVEQYNATVIAAVHDVVDQLVSLRWLQQEMHEQDAALRLSQRALDIAQARYRSGLANYLQVLATESQLLAQKQQIIQSQSRRRELQLNLIRALGGGYQPGALPDSSAIARAHIPGSKS